MISPEVPAELIGDEVRVRQIIINLISNAVKFTEMGRVTLSVQPQADETMHTPVHDERRTQGIMLHFSVADTGIGIPETKHSLIFESFTQLDRQTTKRYGGSGLGLSIVKRLVGLMGGNIWIESEEGKGTTMHFTARFGLVCDRADSVAPCESSRIISARSRPDAPAGRGPARLFDLKLVCNIIIVRYCFFPLFL